MDIFIIDMQLNTQLLGITAGIYSSLINSITENDFVIL
jgi:hypothetical protein